MNIDEMEAGRELDALVAEKVVKLREPGLYESFKGIFCDVWYHPWMERTVNLCRSKLGASNNRFEWMYWDGEGVLLPNYSTDIADAFEAVDYLIEYAFGFELQWLGATYGWWCKIGKASATARTRELAICRAALKAVEGEK